MRSWMIGIVAGYILVGFMPFLLSGWYLVGLLCFAIVVYRIRCPGAFLCCGFLLGISAGTLYGAALINYRLASHCEAIPITVEGKIASLPRHSDTRFDQSRQRFEFEVEQIDPPDCSGPRLLLLSYYGEVQLHPGERWRMVVKLKRPWGLANPGSFNMQSWYAQSAIDATGNVKKDRASLLSADNGVNYHLVRQRISDSIEKLGIDDKVRGILRAITVADKSGVDGQLWTLLQFYGINHLLVISGLHISIVAGAGYLLGAPLGRLVFLLSFTRAAAVVPGTLALLFAFGYAALAGFALATVRALCMLACLVLASLFSRSSLSGNNFLIAAVLILSVNPLSAVGSGFWLSFSAVACLLWLGSWRVQTRLPLRLLHTHFYMALAMIPLGGWWFGGVSLVAVAANLVLVPLVGLFVVPVALLAVVSTLLEIPGGPFLWRVSAWPVVQLLAPGIAFAESHRDSLYAYLSPNLPEVFLGLLALALLVVPLPRSLKLLIPVLAIPVFLPRGPALGHASPDTRISVLDVGQGTAVIVQNGINTLVYDTGGGDPDGLNMASTVLLPYLRSRGVQSLDTLVVSHRDNDHSAGAETLVRAMPIHRVRVGSEAGAYSGAQKCRAGEAWRWPTGISFQILSPGLGADTSANNSSCVLQLRVGNTVVLFPGDIDAKRERELVLYWRSQLRADVLLVPHHGSQTSSSYSWLKTVQANHILLSYGYLNQFGHPHRDVLSRYSTTGGRLWATAKDGALEIELGPTAPAAVKAFRNAWHPYWM